MNFCHQILVNYYKASECMAFKMLYLRIIPVFSSMNKYMLHSA